MSATESKTPPDTVARAPHIFISFASGDVELAHRTVQSLERSGLRCWISDRDIEPTASYPAAITRAVAESGVVLLLLTEASNSSLHVLKEIELAFNKRRPILPIRVAGTTPSSDLQYFLSTTQWLDAGAAYDETDLARIEPLLKELLRRKPARGLPRNGETRWWIPVAAVAMLVIATVVAFALWSGRPTEGPSANNAVQPAAPIAGASGGPAVTSPARGADRTAAPSGVSVKTNPRDSQAYVWVPPGRFMMGCSAGDSSCEDDEKPAHPVDISSGFWLARTEVTAAQYRKGATAPGTGREERDETLPAAAVTWAAAKAYCAGVGGRLPAEAEWEYAARAGTGTRYYDSLPAIAWFSETSDERPRPVGTKAPNAFGLHDMLGNVSEWVRDRYYNAYDDSSDHSTVEEPLAGNASAVARGGSWLSDTRGVRVSRRLEMPPDAEEPHIGFRCAIEKL